MNTFRLYPEQASSFAPQLDALYLFLVAVSAFFTLLVFGLIVYFAIKYRTKDPDAEPRPLVESTALELIWTGVPFLIAMVIFVWGAKLYFDVFRDPGAAMQVHVIGKQWMWKIEHPEGRREINELHLPLGQRVELTMGSQDVIHSFYIPAFRVKMDVMPGRYSKMSFVPTKTGEYHLFCAEYCGNQHSGMIGKVVVMEPEQYQSWLSGVALDETPIASGARLFAELGCSTCHGQHAPSLVGLYGQKNHQIVVDGKEQVYIGDDGQPVIDEQYLRDSILDSTKALAIGYKPLMPSFRGQITEEQVNHLVAYIKSLKDAPADPAHNGLPMVAPGPAPSIKPGGNLDQ